jgi:hypothetical protein
VSASQPFTAAFDGECFECGGPILGGDDKIRMWEGSAIHDDCYDPDEDEDVAPYRTFLDNF